MINQEEYAEYLSKFNEKLLTESEEEMKKDIEWLRNSVLELKNNGNPEINKTEKERELGRVQQWAWSNCIDRVYELINQLDEPEVLSQEVNIDLVLDDLKEFVKKQQSLSQNIGLAHTPAGNDTHYRQYDFVLECIGEYEPSDELKELVPKQEKVKVPRFVADILEENTFADLPTAFEELFSANAGHYYGEDVCKWIVSNEEAFARAWLDGYTVEEEQKYYARIKGWELFVDFVGAKYWGVVSNSGRLGFVSIDGAKERTKERKKNGIT